jgi:signal transduction histidine kinase
VSARLQRRKAQAGHIVVWSLGPAGLLTSVRRAITRGVQGLTWSRVGAMIVFCALYGAMLGGNPKTGGAPETASAYLVGVAAAATHFFPVFLAVILTAGFAPKRPLPRAIALGLAVAFGVVLGYLATLFVREWLAGWMGWAIAPRRHDVSALTFVVMGWVGVAIYLLQERDRAAAQALHDEAEYQLDLARKMSEAQLQVLQSQIEPHFLFNSLAHVRRLYLIDPKAGRAMMRHLSSYMVAALPALRESAIALGEDLDLAIAYLNVHQVRMGARLGFEIDVPTELRQTPVPPMMITTLAENSIKHGLSPLPRGGTVRIEARPEGDTLRIEVADTGQGFQVSEGAGVGLANVRARLAILYGTAGQLALSRNTPCGVVATIVVPVQLVRSRG